MSSKKWAWGVGGVVPLLMLVACSGTRLNDVGDVNSDNMAGSGATGSETPDVEDAASAQTDLPGLGNARALCGVPGDLLPPPTDKTISKLVLGKWLYCAGAPLLGSMEAGVEFVSDGHFYFLTETADGELLRSKGFDGEGTWEFHTGEYDKDLGPQFDLQRVSGGNGGYLAFAKNPYGMRMSLSVAGPTDFVAVR
jgi:hypothetical protein